MHCGGERRSSKHFGRTRCASGIPTVRAATSRSSGEPCMTRSRPIDTKRSARLSFLGRHSGLDCSEERLQFIRSIVAYPIDEEGRCAVHSTAYSTQEILAHAIGMHVLSHLALERLLIKMECDRIVD